MCALDPATEMTPLEYLNEADKEMAGGNNRKAAGLMWKAIEGTFVALAVQIGMDGGDYKAVASAMEKRDPPYERYYSGNLLFAESLRDHANTDPMEGYELEDYLFEDFMMGAREFILEQYGRGK